MTALSRLFVLESIRDALGAQRDGTEVDPIFIAPVLADKVKAGKFFIFSSTIAVASGSEATWSLENPSASGKSVYIVGMTAANDNTAQVIFSMYKNSVITGGTTRVPWDMNFGTNNSSIVVAKDGSGIRSAGTQLDMRVSVVRDQMFIFSPAAGEELIIVPPGASLQLTGVVPGALAVQQFTVGFRWYEESNGV